MNRLILFILPLLISCDREVIVRPQPDYLLERFEPGEPCPEENYMIFHFPDSSLVLSDTMSNVRPVIFGNGIDEFGRSLDLINNSELIWSFSIYWKNSSLICNHFEFIDYGSYQYFDYKENESGVIIRIAYYPGGVTSYKSTSDSNYFYVYNKKNEDGNLIFCGEFDAVIYNPQMNETIPIAGEFSISYKDLFFNNCP